MVSERVRHLGIATVVTGVGFLFVNFVNVSFNRSVNVVSLFVTQAVLCHKLVTLVSSKSL